MSSREWKGDMLRTEETVYVERGNSNFKRIWHFEKKSSEFFGPIVLEGVYVSYYYSLKYILKYR